MNWDVQKNVWDYIFSKECCPVNFTETPLIVTEPYFNFTSIQEAMTEIFFEEYECKSLLRINGKDKVTILACLSCIDLGGPLSSVALVMLIQIVTCLIFIQEINASYLNNDTNSSD